MVLWIAKVLLPLVADIKEDCFDMRGQAFVKLRNTSWVYLQDLAGSAAGIGVSKAMLGLDLKSVLQ